MRVAPSVMSSVAVIDYGMGNLHSIKKALQYALPTACVHVTANTALIEQSDRVVFPGVGAIRDCMLALTTSGLADTIKEVVTNKPFLGICVGMQALLSTSDENNKTTCLDIFGGHVSRFPTDKRDNNNNRYKVPHMGWNQVLQHPHPLWQGIPQDSRFYFLHSYFTTLNNPQDVRATTIYTQSFASALAKDNVFAVQFHPEKSQTAGIQLLKNFLTWDGKP